MTEPCVHRVQARGIEFEVAEIGEGDRPFVLVHGFTGSRDDFREVLPVLADEGRTVALDLRGHGGSSNSGAEADYQLDALALDLAAALDAAEIDRCDLLGHSMGGMISMRFALANPSRVQSLVLMDTVARPFRFFPPALLAMAGKLIRSVGMEAVFEFLKRSPRPHPPSHLRWREAIGEDVYWDRIRAKIVAMDPAAFSGLGGQPFDGVLEQLPRITCPTTVLVGAEDTVFLAPTEEMADAIPGARKVVIEDAAHSPQLENPTAWLAAIRAHLEWARAGEPS